MKIPKKKGSAQTCKNNRQEETNQRQEEKGPALRTMAFTVELDQSLEKRLHNCALLNMITPKEYVLQAIESLVDCDESTLLVNPRDLKQVENDPGDFDRLKNEGYIFLGQYHKNLGLIDAFPSI